MINRDSDSFISDTLFIAFIVFFNIGLFQLVLNLGMFNSMVFGSRTLVRLFKKKAGSSESLKDEYVEYVKSRQKYTDVGTLVIIGLVCLAASILLS